VNEEEEDEDEEDEEEGEEEAEEEDEEEEEEDETVEKDTQRRSSVLTYSLPSGVRQVSEQECRTEEPRNGICAQCGRDVDGRRAVLVPRRRGAS